MRKLIFFLKNKGFKPLSFLFAALFLSACSFFTSAPSVIDTAVNGDFLVGELTAPKNLKPIVINRKEGLPESFTLNLEACVKYKDRSDASIPHTNFVIEYQTNFPSNKPVSFTVRSDFDGCIQWEEKYGWKHFNKPIWIGLNRRISTKNNAIPGHVDITVAVNPYLGESDQDRPPLLDQRYSASNSVFTDSYKEDGLNFLTSQESSKENWHQLWASKIDIQFRRFSINQESDLPEPLAESASPQQKDNFQKQITRELQKYETPCAGPKDSSCYKRHLGFEITIPLELRGYNTHGDIRQDIPLTGGKYNIEIQLIADFNDPQGEKYRLHEEVCIHKNKGLRMESGGGQTTRFLSLNCLMKIPYFRSYTEYKLLVEVGLASESENLPFKRFQGIYTLGQLNFSAPRDEFSIDNNMDEIYQSVLGSADEIDVFSAMNIQDIYSIIDKREGASFQLQSGFYIPNLFGENEFKMSNIISGQIDIQEDLNEDAINRKCQKMENPVIRTVSFVGTVNLTDNLETGDLKNIPFRVFIRKPDKDGKLYIEEYLKDGRIPSTDPNGHITIPVSLEHKVYDRQRYFRVEIHLISEDGSLHGKVLAMLNPWQRAFQAHQDGTALSRDEIRSAVDGVSNPELVINQFKSVNLFPSFGLDKFLNLNLYHRIYFLFQPFVKRHDDVSFGLNHRARALLRDGYYMVRMMLLRNPQETLKTQRAYSSGNLERERARLLDWEHNLKPEELDYFTHTDMIVQAEANFMNVYMPLYISNRQFYYIASRNLLSIEVVPVDPQYFKYKLDQNACQVDTEKMTYKDWKPFVSHELINHPYVGAFNAQNWTNWNVMREVEDLDTDALIAKSKDGSNYKKFSLRLDPNEEEANPNALRLEEGGQASSKPSQLVLSAPGADFVLKSDCAVLGEGNTEHIDINNEADEQWFLSYLKSQDDQSLQKLLDDQSLQELLDEHDLSGDWLQTLIDSAKLGHDPSLPLATEGKNPLPTEQLSDRQKQIFQQFHQAYREKCGPEADSMRAAQSPQLMDQARRDAGLDEGGDILKSFADKNALRLVQLEGAEGARFVEDIARAFEKTQGAPHLLDTEEILPDLTPKDQKRLKARFQDECGRRIGEFNLARAPLIGESWFQDKLCRHEILKKYIEELESADPSSVLDQAHLSYLLLKIRQTETWKKLQQSEFSLTEERLKAIIDNRSLTQRPGGAPALALASSLCHFWFDSYLPDYLQRDQQLSAYTDYVTKFDLYQILEQGPEANQQHAEFFAQSKELTGSFMEMIGFSKDPAQSPPENLRACHSRYLECIERDHCRLNSLNNVGRDYCDAYSSDSVAEDNSCGNVLREECAKDARFHPLCKKICNQYDTLDPVVSCGVKEGQCHTDLNAFCRINPDHEVCYKLSNRCIVNYRSCLQAEDMESVFQPDKILKKECLMIRTKESEYERWKSMAENYTPISYYFPASYPVCELYNPLQSCLENPYRFFKFESKMAVHELSNEDPVYTEGRSFGFNVAGNFSLGSYMNWSSKRSTSLTAKLGGGWNLSAISGQKRSFTNASFNPGLDVSASMGAEEGNSARRAVDVRAAEGIYYTVESPTIELKAVEFQKCLVVKPRPNAFFARYIADANLVEDNVFEEFEGIWSESAERADFKKFFVSRPGLLLCNANEQRDPQNAEVFNETYYYISQDTRATNTVQLLNLFDLANRPLVHILRGRREFVKFYHLHKGIVGGDNGRIDENLRMEAPPENMFINYPHPVEEAVGLSLILREFNETGFHPGIYDYAENADQELDASFTEEDKGWAQSLFEGVADLNIFSVPSTPDNSITIQE